MLHFMMAPELERLIALQRLESTIAEARSAIALQPQRLAELDARLEDTRQVVTTAKERLKINQEARRDAEKDVAVYQGRLTKFKDQLSAVSGGATAFGVAQVAPSFYEAWPSKWYVPKT